jgi:hypothetical protein
MLTGAFFKFMPVLVLQEEFQRAEKCIARELLHCTQLLCEKCTDMRGNADMTRNARQHFKFSMMTSP